MPIDPTLLRNLSAKHPQERPGVEATIRGIHRAPVLRDWVTIESVALVPVPIYRNGQWSFLALLTVPKQLEDGTDGYLAPWGAVEWSWPEQKVTQMIDLRLHEKISQLREKQKFIKKVVTAGSMPLALAVQAQQEKNVFIALDTLFATSVKHPSLEHLAELYVGLLPREMYLYYWILVPESQEWLRSDTAIPTRRTSSLVQASTPKLNSDDTEVDSPIPSSDQRSTRLPADLSGEVERWLSLALQLAESFGVQAITAELRRLANRHKLPGFRLTFVGEFNRGKSTLINRLLERPVLPVRVVPTTSTITSIVAGEKDSLQVFFQDGRQQTRQLTADVWNDLIVNDQTGQLQEEFPRVRVTINQQWLKETDIEIIDTPGAGDVNVRRTALISDVLGQSDAAVVLVSAILPLSLTERAFLEQKVMGQHIPLVLVVVSMLDTLPQDQKSAAFDMLRKRLDQISPDIPMLSSHPINAQDMETLEAIRSQINVMVTQSDRSVWRSRQAAGNLADYLGQLIEFGQSAIAAASMDEAKREEARQKARHESKLASSQWESISLQWDSHRLDFDQELRRRLNKARDGLCEAMSLELSKAPDPKSWWEKDFPFRLRHELFSLARGYESFIIDTLTRDTKILQDEVMKTFGARILQKPTPPPSQLEVRPGFRELTLADIQRQRFFSRVGSGAATIAGYLLIGPLGSAISVATGLISDYVLNKKIDEQRQQLIDEIARSIDRTLAEYTRLLSERLNSLYSQIAQDMRREQTSWLAAKEGAIEAAHASPKNTPAWQQLIDDTSKLQSNILAALEK